MKTFALAHASANNWQVAANQCLQSLQQQYTEASIGFIYITDEFAADLNSIHYFLHRQLKVKHWLGTVGLGICCTGHEYYDTPAMVVALADIPENSFKLIHSLETALQRDSSRHDTPGVWKIALLHADPRVFDLTNLIERAADHYGFLVGGLTSSRRQSLQIADGIHSGQVNGVLLGGAEINVISGITQGCTPIGAVREITQCSGNIIIEIDNRPAYDVFAEDIGELLLRDIERIGHFIFAGLPVSGVDNADYLVRNIVGLDQVNKLVAIGDHLHNGMRIMFCKRDTQSAREDLHRMLTDVKKRLSGSPKGGIYYSCIGRGKNLFDEQAEELNTITKVLGEFPLAGFFCNGEISNNRLYGYTGVLTVFN